MSFRRLADILPQTLAGLGIAERVWLERLVACWQEAVHPLAPELATRGRPTGLRAGVLEVWVPTPELAALVAARSADLVRALEAVTEAGVLREVRARTGTVDSLGPPPASAGGEPPN